MVVEGLEALTADVEDSRQPTRPWVALEDPNSYPRSVSRNAAVRPARPAPTTAISIMTPRYPTSSVPSKRAAAFYAAYFGVLALVLLSWAPIFPCGE